PRWAHRPPAYVPPASSNCPTLPSHRRLLVAKAAFGAWVETPTVVCGSIFPLLVPFPRQCCRNAGLPATNCGSHDQREVTQRHHSQLGCWLISQLECDENEKLKNWTGPTLPWGRGIPNQPAQVCFSTWPRATRSAQRFSLVRLQPEP